METILWVCDDINIITYGNETVLFWIFQLNPTISKFIKDLGHFQCQSANVNIS